MRFAALLLAAAALIAGAQHASWASVTVVAPAAGAGQVAPWSDEPSEVGTHSWAVTSDEPGGAALTISAVAFAHASVPSARPPITLELTRTAGTSWTVTTSQSTSDSSTPAQVVATSSEPGDATFDVTVIFDPLDASTLPAGSYSTTLVGTISALP